MKYRNLKHRKIEKILDAEKIAAGEIVDRPANIVKELIENSIDAEASEIRVVVRKAGKTLIQVIDNGIGIPNEEIIIAFERYTSSKIRDISDLEKLTTLGFRGEALASIAAVSKLEIISRTETEVNGVQLFIEGGKIVSKREVSCPIGTNIKIKNIFYNLPARQKFLKKDATELGHITDIIQRYTLAYSGIHFIYQHNDLDVLNCPMTKDLRTTVFHIYGKKVAKVMEPIDYADKDSEFKIHGLLGHPQISKKNRTDSSLFINDRYIISDILFRAIEEAYEGTLMISKYPFFIIFIDLNPSVIDFNVHPKKLQVRFEKEDSIYNRVYNIVHSFIEDKFIQKEAKYIATELEDFIPSNEIKLVKNSSMVPDTQKDEDSLEVSLNKKSIQTDETVQLRLNDEKSKESFGNQSLKDTVIREKYILSKSLPKLRLIPYTGQLKNKTYVLLEGTNANDEDGFFILDQHASSERINKEKFLHAYETSQVSLQKLISPLKIDVSPSEKIFIEDNLKEIKKLGFKFEHFGGNTFILRGIPTIMGKIPDINIIKEVISDITNIGKDKSFSETKEEIINYLACHKSIRGGDELTLKDIRNLLIELGKCKNPYHCAHGRPTLRFFSFKELDKLFKRIV